MIIPLMDTLLQQRPDDAHFAELVRQVVLDALAAPQQPSPHELVEAVHARVGVSAHFELVPAVRALKNDATLPRAWRDYLESILKDEELLRAMLGLAAPGREIESSFDQLIHRSRQYCSASGFHEMIEFIGRFKDYAPYNNMLVHIQNPGCKFFATESDWRRRFGRTIKEDARPMLILAPMRPLICVYDIDQTDGPPLPAELEGFSKFEGVVPEDALELLVANAARHDAIRVDFKPLSTALSGFATFARGSADRKMRVAIHAGLDTASRLGVLCHELAHIFLGHLGSDDDRWWPARSNLDRYSVEIEAEAVAYLVTSRLGLRGSSHTYVSRHLREGEVPAGVSLDLIAKVAGRIEQMTQRKLAERQPTMERKK
ncbi:MAG: hypothetical protein AB1651_03140 [Pseudomonadota bacterium]